MAITINGSGTISGITAGGLPDGVITADDLASGAITSGALPAGSVLQVVQGKLSTEFSTTSLTPVDVGLSASITPSSSSSKILILCSIQSSINASGGGSWTGWYDLLRGSTKIADSSRQWTQDSGGPQATGSAMSIVWLDSPATTSSTTYKLQAYVGNSSGTLRVTQDSVGESTVTLMEIAG